ncbi:helix-turn-helix domain-containing protein [Shewanella sp. C32]|uniref:Helix-turn-helix domain-containing protein n=1 Tax=Shewanella electrica TaxID=515560 RepID=A0ABT2FQK2_9GAMM|nr:helix-turn-helix domain-containing protein [Shewanella electrica]MCH1926892.1 helix-turn-helix domain-containing protein [Shewanella electrica]MCS4558518.1 helix-turn-helix domain-containing protein [Shewanella electrica]
MSMELMVKAMNAKVGNALRKLVLLKLADNANDKGECWPSYQHIADQCEIAHSTVRKHIKDLESAGYLTIHPRKTELGHGSNIYKLQLPPKPPMLADAAPMPSDSTPMPSDSTPMPSDSIGGCREIAGGMPSDSTPPMPSDSTRTSHSFEPVNEPLKDHNTGSKTSTAKFDFSSWPAEPSAQILKDWLAVRKAKKAPFTQTVINRLAKHLHQAAQHGLSVDECLGQCAVRGWVGFEFGWLVNAGVVATQKLAIPDHGQQPKQTVDDGFPAWEGE